MTNGQEARAEGENMELATMLETRPLVTPVQRAHMRRFLAHARAEAVRWGHKVTAIRVTRSWALYFGTVETARVREDGTLSPVNENRYRIGFKPHGGAMVIGKRSRLFVRCPLYMALTRSWVVERWTAPRPKSMERVAPGHYQELYRGVLIEVRQITKADDERITSPFWQVIVGGACDETEPTKRQARATARETVDRQQARAAAAEGRE